MTKKEYRGERVTVWPVYIDSSARRSNGRRIPLSEAVRNPTVEEIEEAARQLGLDPEVVEARYPRAWWKYDKAVLVRKAGSKLETLRMLARKVSELRASRRRF